MAEQRIGRYTILEEIASGTQGAVHRAFDPESGQIVALKVLHASLAGDRSYLERFHREATITSSIDHPNVVGIREVGESGGRHFIAMEFLPESLGRLIESAGRLPIPSAVSFAAQIADGLAAAHARGVVHRDVKPQNVLIAADGTAKVTDFGIARGESLSTMTATGMMMGTPYYMSPEQCLGERADARSDVYSLGCVLYQMLTGALPFEASTPLAVLRKHTDEPPRLIREIREDIPAPLSDIVARALAKEPEQRFTAMAEMAEALRAAAPELATRSIPSSPLRPMPAVPETARRPPPPPPPPPVAGVPPAPPIRGAGSVCADCGAPWRAAAGFCTRCGSPNFRPGSNHGEASRTAVCMDCGAPWQTGAGFCTRCGSANFRLVSAAPPGAPVGSGGIRVTPEARGWAMQLGIDLSQVIGTGRGGRVTKADVDRFSRSRRKDLPPGRPRRSLPGRLSASSAKRLSGPGGPRKEAVEKNGEGLDLFGAAHYERAIAAFSEAISLEPEWEVIYRNRAEAHRRQGREASATEDIRKADFLRRKRMGHLRR